MMVHRDSVITLYSDCLSPFSYFAFTVIDRYVKAGLWPATLVLKPILLAGVMAATGNLPPGARPWAAAAAKVSQQDMARNMKWFNVPEMLPGPTNFFGPDGPADPTGLARDFRYQRLLTAIGRLHPAAMPEATRLTFELIWASPKDRDENGAVQVTEEVLKRIGLEAGLDEADADDMVAELGADENKAVLKATVTEAVELGMYGAPFIKIESPAAGDTPMVCFGSDRFEQLAFANGWTWVGPDPSRTTRVGAKL